MCTDETVLDELIIVDELINVESGWWVGNNFIKI